MENAKIPKKRGKRSGKKRSDRRQNWCNDQKKKRISEACKSAENTPAVSVQVDIAERSTEWTPTFVQFQVKIWQIFKIRNGLPCDFLDCVFPII